MSMAKGEPDDAGPVPDLHYAAVPAEPERLPGLRRALVEWAGRVGLSAERVETLALAGYEALANAAAHAYRDGAGVLEMRAAHRTGPERLEVTVSDQGDWRPEPADRGGLGGRGLVLIRNLADHAEVTTDESGTTVSMTWDLAPRLATNT